MDQGGTTPAPTKDQDQWPWWAKWAQKAACVLAGSSKLAFYTTYMLATKPLHSSG